ncbi:hypothetical protein FC99_GL002569 [Levilactobacillus koreensis JCM 16448]|uniref:Transcobalamin-like C-terminal domain-containing protein n=1 Tax=Levilactobacillus koreensis TaxID=637971 RepID=A0AAC8UY25_9LACO|nr:DUF4430 domain-containing protein [Levilactobacillus koreensis]AKP65380.1 hypothetical protein ABN16_10445 [Levilactobacillus koreensis]KRK91031.1 hypothetical protein FC99_GL002569 [Levilactobacillus koreensis JCM 16448]
MKKSVWIIVAVVVTIFTMGTALAMQQHSQQSTAPQTRSSSNQSSSVSQASSSSSQTKKVAAKKEAHKKSSASKRKASSTRAKATKKAKRSSKAASTSNAAAKKVTTARSTKKAATTKRAAKATQPATKRQTAKTTKKSTSKSQSTGKVHLTVTGYKKTFFNGSVAISKNATVFSALKSSKLKLVYQSGVAVYVSSINGLAENDVKVGSGWKYKVNGKFIDEAANTKHVTNGDDVHWYFTTAGY